MALRIAVLLALADLIATASIWWYLIQFKIKEIFLFALAGVWVFAICALVGLLLYVSSQVSGKPKFLMQRSRG